MRYDVDLSLCYKTTYAITGVDFLNWISPPSVFVRYLCTLSVNIRSYSLYANIIQIQIGAYAETGIIRAQNTKKNSHTEMIRKDIEYFIEGKSNVRHESKITSTDLYTFMTHTLYGFIFWCAIVVVIVCLLYFSNSRTHLMDFFAVLPKATWHELNRFVCLGKFPCCHGGLVVRFDDWHW